MKPATFDDCYEYLKSPNPQISRSQRQFPIAMMAAAGLFAITPRPSRGCGVTASIPAALVKPEVPGQVGR